jgi:hypothetical protein
MIISEKLIHLITGFCWGVSYCVAFQMLKKWWDKRRDKKRRLNFIRNAKNAGSFTIDQS